MKLETGISNRAALLSKAQYYILLLIIFLLPFSRLAIPPLIVLFVAIWLVSGNLKEKLTGVFKNKIGILLVSFYLLHLLGMFYTSTYNEGWFDLEVKFSLVLFPLLIFGSPVFFKNNFFSFLWCFVLGNLVASLICLFYGIYQSVFAGRSFPTYYEISLFLHTSYAAMYVSFAMSILIFFLFINKIPNLKYKNLPFSNLLIFFATVTIFCVMIYLYSSRAGFVSGIIVLLFAVVYYLFQKKVKWYLILFAGIGIAGILFQIVKQNPRFEVLAHFFKNPQNINYQSKENAVIRYLIDLEAMELIRENYLFGVGTGDVKSALMERYKTKNFTEAWQDKLNVHNQYLETFVGLGIIGFLTLIIMTGLPFYMGWKQKNILLMLFSIIIFINFMFDSMFNMQFGVVFYSFFNSLLLVNVIESSTKTMN